MSVFRECALRCPHCDHRWSASMAVSVNGERSPALRAQIRAGTFQQMACPACGRVTPADGPLLYVEVAARRWIGCHARADEPRWRELESEPLDTWRRAFIDHAPATVRKLAGGFVIRAVFGLPALREKLACFDAGLDDRLLEALKLDLMRTPGADLTLHPAARPVLVEADETRLCFALGDGRTLDVPRARYDALAADRGAWADAIRKLSAGPYVDVGRLMLP